MPYLGKNLVCSIFVQELEFLNLEPKVPYLGAFAAILKNYCHIWNQHVQFPLLQSLVQKKKKNPLIWDKKCQIWVSWGSNLNILF